MRLLIGTPYPETYSRLAAAVPGGLTLQCVGSREQLLFRMEEAFDHIAVDLSLFEDVYPWDVVRELEKRRGTADISLILQESVYDSLYLEVLTRLTDETGMALLPHSVTPDEGAAALLGRLSKQSGKASEKKVEEEGKIVAIWSAHHGDGASTVAVNTALALAAHSELSVGLLDLNLKNPALGVNLNLSTGGLSNVKLRPRLHTHSLTPDELLSSCVVHHRLHVLPGSPRRDSAGDFTPEMIDCLLQVARSTFDLTLVDLDSYPDNAATICGVRGADERWLVVRPRFDSYQSSWREWYSCYWKYCGLAPSDIHFVMNQAGSRDDSSAAARFLGMEGVGEFPLLPTELGVKAVNEGIPFWELPGAEPFRLSADELASRAASLVGVEWKEKSVRRKSFWRGFERRLAWR
ncbi:hypothetical protein [Gorillibacterium sp. CAU 1737]|uniref:AAA family ATPase n=1 Tax=Gorillibacterium sp. CAU 1737 TaxID=3140362 RepID=UPI003261A4F5